MKKALRKSPVLWHYSEPMGTKVKGPNPNMHGDCSELRGDCTGLEGDCSELQGNCSNLWGDCTGLAGDCTGLEGNLDECCISEEQRARGVHLADLVN